MYELREKNVDKIKRTMNREFGRRLITQRNSGLIFFIARLVPISRPRLRYRVIISPVSFYRVL